MAFIKGTVLSSSVVKKMIVGATGLCLSLFLVSHFIGNLLMIIGADLFNTYAYTLTSNPLIYVAEAILLLVFVLHGGYALKLVYENYVARPEKYYMKKNSGRGATFASSSMKYTGPLILIFLVIHLINFKYGEVFYTTVNGIEMRDFHRLMLVFFQSSINVIMYVAFMLVIAIHVSHGVWSVFQTFGILSNRCDKGLRTISNLFALFIFIGYSIFPIWACLQEGVING
ncbi:MAG: hypothetical protein CR982_10250 [Candidatus Cloacimonadota bacterium]|nr:MAG: hypothetical protein CR982_10250 [Candidatus Cloacimonadota bacterium]PIE77545.1 MAG: hypothetical protein CSA15_12275 [Candidatus Delongbacteria bacterium]